jgi:AsmA family protein
MSRATKTVLWSGSILLFILASCVAVLLTFDWNRAKPWISSHVTDATGRRFAIRGNLGITWHAPPGDAPGWRGWIPWPRLTAQDVRFGNPDWAQTPLMVEAQQVTFSINPLPLIEKRIVIPTLSLDTPKLVLERQQDGRNNWTFDRNDSQPSAWKLDLQRLALHRGAIQIIDAIRDAKLHAKLDMLDDAHAEGYRIGWTIGGTLGGEKVEGRGKAGSILSLKDQNTEYPLEADIHVGKTSLQAKGTLTDPRKLAALDLQLKISGASLSQLYPVFGVVLPQTRAYFTEGHLVGGPSALGGNWKYENFSGRIGESDIAGDLRYEARRPRPMLEGTVESHYLNFSDLAPLIGADSKASKAERDDQTVQPPNKVLPVEKFNNKRWTRIDTDVQFTGHRIVRKQQLPIDNLVTRMRLQDGVLSLAPLKFGIAGGKLVSNLTLNGNSNPIKADLKLSARHVQLKRLFPKMTTMQSSLGEINGDASLSASGDSVAGLLGSSNGEIKAVINQGTISKLLLEEMGLNIGSIVVTQLFGDEQVQLNCAFSDFNVKNGVMHARAFVVDTPDATIHMEGTINLAKEQLALSIYPETKGLRLISLRSPLYVKGTFKNPKVNVDKGILALKAGSALALGVLAPVAAALIPLVNVGPGEKSPCGTLLAQANLKPQEKTAGKSAETTSGR